METNIENQTMQISNERPQFLSVLCILTWVCSGFMFISTAVGIINRPSVEQMEESVEKMRAVNTEAADKMEEVFENQNSGAYIANSAIGLIALGFSAFGAAMMWQLKRKGFFVYLGGELLQYAGMFLAGSAQFSVVAAMFNMDTSIIMALMMGVMLLFDIIFFAMYGSNLKYMKN